MNYDNSTICNNNEYGKPNNILNLTTNMPEVNIFITNSQYNGKPYWIIEDSSIILQTGDNYTAIALKHQTEM